MQIEDKLLEMIVETRKKLNIPTSILCEGICSVQMYNSVINGKRFFDRITIKRFFARMGVDNANYEHYLHYDDYDVWLHRMRLINAIESGQSEDASKLLNDYLNGIGVGLSKSRSGIEEQFCIFMKLQIIRHESMEEYESVAEKMYEKAAKLTVPNIDNADIEEFLLSPLEFCIVLEYLRMRVKNTSWENKWKIYRRFVYYLENSAYGKLSKIKTYPKLVVCMYEDICAYELYTDEKKEMYMEMFEYCERALSYLKDRKFMYYMTEILEIRLELLNWLKTNHDMGIAENECEKLIEETKPQLKCLKEIYEEYGLETYMKDDCYLYRESGIYCIGDVIKNRRKMMHLSREKLCEGICDVRTIMREENRKHTMHRNIFRDIFKRLMLNPDYIDMGIVTGDKKDIELYEELRYAENLFAYERVKELVSELVIRLPKHPINEQVLTRIESNRQYKNCEKNIEEHIETLVEALKCTVSLEDIVASKKNMYLTNEELITLYLISEAYKYAKMYDEAYAYAKQLYEYSQYIEQTDIVDGRLGIYELLMEYLANLYGDIEKYEESNNISDKLIKLCLRTRRSHSIHFSLYNKAWNNNECKKTNFDYCKEIYRCIYFSQLTRDTNNEEFYNNKLANCYSR